MESYDTNLPVSCSSSLASSNIERTWFALAIVALISLKIVSASAHDEAPRIRATVVLPHLI